MRDALAFLTTLPVRGGPLHPRAVALFPLAGLVLGAGWVAAAALGALLGVAVPEDTRMVGTLVGALVGAALVLLVDLRLTGGLHLDGLADTADGLASHHPPDGAREVMKDPRIGAVGAATLGTVLLLRFALLTALLATLATPDPLPTPGALPLLVGPATLPAPAGLIALAVAPVAGRYTMVLLLARARPYPGSLAGDAVAAAGRGPMLAATVLTAVLAVLLAGVAGPVIAALAAAAGLLAHTRWARRLGTSGDTVGATGLTAETVALAGLLAAAALA